ncbi:MAG: prolipoprotein diacylglyceryl transferase [Gemmatimonadales bacterium]|jgi:phosphatidylglycerol:prolipoprotein diacylglycerol transferase|nr:prolipoprotein diacylglyceryl transferase [Gemmatimonadales bacterium]
MTVYPLVFHLGPLEITGFGIMVMMAFFMAGWAMQARLRELNLNDQFAWDIIVAGVIGGILGAKLWYVALHPEAGLLSRGGLVWYGGLIGGAAAVIFNSIRIKVPVRFTLDLAAPALALGYALGRVGCFLVQDDYGIPTTLPWGMKFPNGLPPTTARNLAAWHVPIPEGVNPSEVLAVHPTQLYETAAMLFVFWLLWRLRDHRRGTGWLFGLYLMLAGTERFLIEFLRAKDDRFFGTFSLAQVAALAVVTLGAVLAARFGRLPRSELGTVASLRPDVTPPGGANTKEARKGTGKRA